MYLELKRNSDNGIQTTGVMVLYSSDNKKIASFETLELSWRNNARQISCVPDGVYVVNPHFSLRFGRCFELRNVIGRSNILIHKGNFNKDTKGCILIGHGYRDIDGDGSLDVLNSGIAMKLLRSVLETTTTISINSKWLGYELK